MADKKHLEILRQGVKVWNQWIKNQHIFALVYDLSGADLHGANLKGVTLSGGNLEGVNLSRANLRGAKLAGVNFSKADLSGADFSHADLEIANFAEANLAGANLICANIHKANLSDANLSNAVLVRTDIMGTNLQRANLCGACLFDTQASYADFENAILTGCCIRDWNINSQTNLQNVKCEYIYIKGLYSFEESRYLFRDRIPYDPDKIFSPGEFTKLFQKAFETIDLFFKEGVDWQAVAYSLKNIQVLNEDTSLEIQKIEKKGDGDVLISVSVPENVDKGKIEGDFWQGYKFAQESLEGQFKARIEDKQQEINRLFSIVNNQSQQLVKAQKLLAEANKTINVGKNYNENL